MPWWRHRAISLAVATPVAVLGLAAGCASPGVAAGPVYFPPPPAVPRAVHVKSFNRLYELVPAERTLLDILRGGPISPFVGTPAGIAYRNGHLYICDTERAAVHDWDLNTGEAKRIGWTGDTRLAKPVAVAVGNDGTVYVADTGRSEVVACNRAGMCTRHFKPADRESYKPVAVAVSGSELYAADIAAHRIDVFGISDGAALGSFGGIGSEPGSLYFPMGLALSAGGSLYVSDMMNGRVQVFDREHHPTISMGRPGDRYGDMAKPRQIALGPDGVIFIADAEFAHVHLFNGQGQLLMLLGGPDDRPGGTPMPVGVAVATGLPETITHLVPPDFAAKYYLFVSNSIGSKRISLFAVGRGR